MAGAFSVASCSMRSRATWRYSCRNVGLPWGGTLRLHLQHVERLARRHEQVIALRAAKRNVGTHLGQADAAEQLALRIEHYHAGIAEWTVRTAPDVAGHVATHSIRPAFHTVHHHVEELAPVRRLAALHVECVDGTRAAIVAVTWPFAAGDHIRRLVI